MLRGLDTVIRILFSRVGVVGIFAAVFGLSLAMGEESQRLSSHGLPSAEEAGGSRPKSDWLLDASFSKARVLRGDSDQALVLDNGLVRRTFRLEPNVASVAIDHLGTGESFLRSARAEGLIEVDGHALAIGGLSGQRVHNFLTPAMLGAMRDDPAAWHCVGYHVGATEPRFAWKPRKEWMSLPAPWPPPGVKLSFDYRATPALIEAVVESETSRRGVLLEDDFRKLGGDWTVQASPASARSSFQNEGKVGEIMAFENTAVYAERPLPAATRVVQCRVDPGTDRSASWGPGITLIWPNHVVKWYLRSGHGKFGLTVDGREDELDSLEPGRPYWLRMRLNASSVVCEYSTDGEIWRVGRSVPFLESPGAVLKVRLGKTSNTGGAQDHGSKGNLERCRIERFSVFGGPAKGSEPVRPSLADLVVRVHYELYDGLPLFSKWLTLHNTGKEAVRLNAFTVERLAVVEAESIVGGKSSEFRKSLLKLDVFTDYAFGGGMTRETDDPSVAWKVDPLYETQVNYERQTPCLLECSPKWGPDVEIAPGGTFESFRVFELLHDSTERERRGLTVRRALRALAPWTEENPILMHVRSADPKAVKLAIDQCAEVGFEMVIMTFGSGFNIENPDPSYLAQVKALEDYARSKNVELGGYSLLASRSIGPDDDCINPKTGRTGGMTFGESPCLGSQWGKAYFQKLYHFFETTGAGILEHDGSYPGDVCASTKHPGHRGLLDSQWRQWEQIRDFYRWCRGRGIYLNVPDWYYLSGSNKCAMGYRETNWSLPRAEQELVERQNIYDGTWEKTPSMGWMFVPLTEYQGGGAAATIEPLDEHREHYETRLANLFGAGVQACYRGPRLYDSEATKALVQRWVRFYKDHRAILDSDLIHLRRADGRDWDGWLHVNPALKERGLAVLYNPLEQPITRRLSLPLYGTGLKNEARIRENEGAFKVVPLGHDGRADLDVTIPGRGRTILVIEER